MKTREIGCKERNDEKSSISRAKKRSNSNGNSVTISTKRRKTQDNPTDSILNTGISNTDFKRKPNEAKSKKNITEIKKEKRILPRSDNTNRIFTENFKLKDKKRKQKYQTQNNANVCMVDNVNAAYYKNDSIKNCRGNNAKLANIKKNITEIKKENPICRRSDHTNRNFTENFKMKDKKRKQKDQTQNNANVCMVDNVNAAYDKNDSIKNCRENNAKLECFKQMKENKKIKRLSQQQSISKVDLLTAIIAVIQKNGDKKESQDEPKHIVEKPNQLSLTIKNGEDVDINSKSLIEKKKIRKLKKNQMQSSIEPKVDLVEGVDQMPLKVNCVGEKECPKEKKSKKSVHVRQKRLNKIHLLTAKAAKKFRQKQQIYMVHLLRAIAAKRIRQKQISKVPLRDKAVMGNHGDEPSNNECSIPDNDLEILVSTSEINDDISGSEILEHGTGSLIKRDLEKVHENCTNFSSQIDESLLSTYEKSANNTLDGTLKVKSKRGNIIVRNSASSSDKLSNDCSISQTDLEVSSKKRTRLNKIHFLTAKAAKKFRQKQQIYMVHLLRAIAAKRIRQKQISKVPLRDKAVMGSHGDEPSNNECSIPDNDLEILVSTSEINDDTSGSEILEHGTGSLIKGDLEKVHENCTNFSSQIDESLLSTYEKSANNTLDRTLKVKSKRGNIIVRNSASSSDKLSNDCSISQTDLEISSKKRTLNSSDKLTNEENEMFAEEENKCHSFAQEKMGLMEEQMIEQELHSVKESSAKVSEKESSSDKLLLEECSDLEILDNISEKEASNSLDEENEMFAKKEKKCHSLSQEKMGLIEEQMMEQELHPVKESSAKVSEKESSSDKLLLEERSDLEILDNISEKEASNSLDEENEMFAKEENKCHSLSQEKMGLTEEQMMEQELHSVKESSAKVSEIGSLSSDKLLIEECSDLEILEGISEKEASKSSDELSNGENEMFAKEENKCHSFSQEKMGFMEEQMIEQELHPVKESSAKVSENGSLCSDKLLIEECSDLEILDNISEKEASNSSDEENEMFAEEENKCHSLSQEKMGLMEEQMIEQELHPVKESSAEVSEKVSSSDKLLIEECSDLEILEGNSEKEASNSLDEENEMFAKEENECHSFSQEKTALMEEQMMEQELHPVKESSGKVSENGSSSSDKLLIEECSNPHSDLEIFEATSDKEASNSSDVALDECNSLTCNGTEQPMLNGNDDIESDREHSDGDLEIICDTIKTDSNDLSKVQKDVLTGEQTFGHEAVILNKKNVEKAVDKNCDNFSQIDVETLSPSHIKQNMHTSDSEVFNGNSANNILSKSKFERTLSHKKVLNFDPPQNEHSEPSAISPIEIFDASPGEAKLLTEYNNKKCELNEKSIKKISKTKDDTLYEYSNLVQLKNKNKNGKKQQDELEVLPTAIQHHIENESPRKQVVNRKRKSLEDSSVTVIEIGRLTPFKVADAALINEVVISPEVSEENFLGSLHSRPLPEEQQVLHCCEEERIRAATISPILKSKAPAEIPLLNHTPKVCATSKFSPSLKKGRVNSNNEDDTGKTEESPLKICSPKRPTPSKHSPTSLKKRRVNSNINDDDTEKTEKSPLNCSPKRPTPSKHSPRSLKKRVNSNINDDDTEKTEKSPLNCSPKRPTPSKHSPTSLKKRRVNSNINDDDTEKTEKSPSNCSPKRPTPSKHSPTSLKKRRVNSNINDDDTEKTEKSPLNCSPKRPTPSKHSPTSLKKRRVNSNINDDDTEKTEKSPLNCSSKMPTPSKHSPTSLKKRRVNSNINDDDDTEKSPLNCSSKMPTLSISVKKCEMNSAISDDCTAKESDSESLPIRRRSPRLNKASLLEHEINEICDRLVSPPQKNSYPSRSGQTKSPKNSILNSPKIQSPGKNLIQSFELDEINEEEIRDKVVSPPQRNSYILKRLGQTKSPENSILNSPRTRRNSLSSINSESDAATSIASPVRTRRRRNSLSGNLTPVRRSRRLSGLPEDPLHE